MLFKIKKSLFLFLCLILLKTSGFGQLNRSYEDWFVGGHFGMTSLWGDVTDNDNHFLPGGPFQNGFYQDRQMMYGFSVGKNISPTYSVRGQFLFGSISSHTIAEKQMMSSTVQDFTLILNVDFIDLFDWSTKSNWDFYGLIGIGLSRYRSVLNSSIVTDSVIDISPNDPVKYNLNKYSSTISIPFGLGVNYKIGKHWVVNAESSIRYLNTDHLDAIVSNKRAFEGFGYLSVGVIYRFDLPRGGSMWSRKSNHSFDAQKDNSSSAYRNGRHNGSVATDPFKNKSNKKSTLKVKTKRKKKTFKTPKK